MERDGMKPILFNTEMVRKILYGTKTVTRRVVNPQPKMDVGGALRWKECYWINGLIGLHSKPVEECAPYKCGDVLYVRETWAVGQVYGNNGVF